MSTDSDEPQRRGTESTSISTNDEQCCRLKSLRGGYVITLSNGDVSEVKTRENNDSAKTRKNNDGDRTSFTPRAHTKEFRVNQQAP